ncbi:MAG: immunoglobulin domain-containing protein [Verrucomicrobiota bacterium]
MNTFLVRSLRIPSLLLAAALQVLPMVRTALPVMESSAQVLAIIFRWGAGVAAALGGVQAVSGASTVITNPLSTNITQGVAFTMRLTTAPNQAGYWTASGLPAGLSLSGTSGSTSWKITGTPTTTGTYSVGLTAMEKQGASASRTTTATLVITVSPAAAAPPVIGTPPASQTVNQGQNATFTVTATGTAPLTYQWRFKSGVLSGQTAASLTLNAVTTNNAGNYDVIVANSSGSVTSAVAVLTVLVPGAPVPPAITGQPVNLTVSQGQPASFTVTATGTAPLSYYWHKGSTLVSTQTTATFSLAAAQTNDAGTYSVIVSNAAGWVTSSNATLTVNSTSQSPYILVQPVSQSVLSGAPASFSVSAGGAATLRYQWYRNGSAINGATSPTLYLPSVQSENAGSYYVVVNNRYGTVQSTTVSLSLILIRGAYNGVFYESGVVSHLSSGSFVANCTDQGAYTANLMIYGRRYKASGRFNAAGFSTNQVLRGTLLPLTLELQVDLTGGDQIRGRVTDGTWSAPLLADRLVFDSAHNPAPQAGQYTLVIPGIPGATDNPQGDSYATLKVDAAGHVKAQGRLADGAPFSQSTAISKSGDWPLYASVTAGQGSVLGWLSFSNRVSDDIHGVVNWVKLQQPSTTYYPMGISLQSTAAGSAYRPPSQGGPVLNFTTGQVQFSGGNLPAGFSNPVQLLNNRLSGSGATVSGTLTPATGLFRGKATDPGTGASVSFSGVVLQKAGSGSGYFLGSNKSGRVVLGP